MIKFLLLLLSACVIHHSIKAQDIQELKVGDKAPSFVLPTGVNTIESFVFPYQNKVMFVFFWSSSTSKENLFKYAKLNQRYSGLEYKTCDGFQVVSIALQSDRKAWEDDIKRYSLSKVSNCIAYRGYKDNFVQSYKITQTPTSFLVDEFGKIIYVNPDIRTIVGYLDERKNTVPSNVVQSKLAGKILIGEDTRPLKNSKLYVLDEKKDTLQTVSTNDAGTFYINNINTSQNLSLNVGKSDQIKEDESIYLASEGGEILSDFTKIPTGFEYKLLDIEMSYLKPLHEHETSIKAIKELTDLNFTENLHKSGGITLSKEATTKLDALIVKLKSYPKARVEITSHTDCKGDAKLNLDLSMKRAKSIETYFISKGIQKTRIKAIGRGEEEILNRCIDDVPCSEAENEINRRTVFRFYQTE